MATYYSIYATICLATYCACEPNFKLQEIQVKYIVTLLVSYITVINIGKIKHTDKKCGCDLLKNDSLNQNTGTES